LALKTRIGALALALVAAGLPTSSAAVEGGGSNWLMGASGFQHAAIPDPGIHFINITFFSDFEMDQDFTEGSSVVTKLNVDATINMMLPTLTGEIERWNARWRFMMAAPLVWLDGEFTVVNEPPEKGQKHAHLGDVGFEAAIGWKEEGLLGFEGLNLDYLTGLLIVTPTGRYDKQEVLNAGRNRWTFQPHLAYTLFHEGTGLDVTQRIMYALNTENPQTNYQSGQEFHFDWSLSKRFDFGLTVGVFGYYYTQTTGDSGSGAVTGNLKGRAYGLGPAIRYSRELFGVPLSLGFRYQKVLQDHNRVDDDSFWLDFAVTVW
jgi:hypothetical protein